VKELSPVARAALSLLQISHCGPDRIAEGPAGTVWFGGLGGVWRFRDGRYKDIRPGSLGHSLNLAADHSGSLWIVQKERVQKYDGNTWSTVLCPYIGKPKSSEARGLYGIAIGTNGNVWIGGTVYGEPKEPWEHDYPFWVVDQERRKRNQGPPMAPLFEFNGKGWRAFGPPHGLSVKCEMSSRKVHILASAPKEYMDPWPKLHGIPL